MDFAEFERLVTEAVDALPAHISSELDNVAFLVEPNSAEGELLGEYIGTPRTERIASDPLELPDRIVLYHAEIVDECDGDHANIKKEIERTLWHEIGHHLGWDDDVLEEVERSKGWRE